MISRALKDLLVQSTARRRKRITRTFITTTTHASTSIILSIDVMFQCQNPSPPSFPFPLRRQSWILDGYMS